LTNSNTLGLLGAELGTLQNYVGGCSPWIQIWGSEWPGWHLLHVCCCGNSCQGGTLAQLDLHSNNTINHIFNTSVESYPTMQILTPLHASYRSAKWADRTLETTLLHTFSLPTRYVSHSLIICHLL